MGTHERRAGTFTYLRNHQARLRRSPLTHAIALALAAGGAAGSAHAQHAFSPAWFAAKGAAQGTAAATGRLPNGLPASSLTAPERQSAAARQKLQTSINNLNLAAQAIAAQQALQKAAREAALANGTSVPDGLGEGGLKVDTNSLTAGWVNARDPVQTASGGKTKVTIEQTADKAILNWETFNVGKETTVAFDQQASWSVLNRVNDPRARPSQIEGQIEAPGTVMIVNRNGIVFSGSSQVNVRNLAAAAAGMTDSQFKKGLYSEGQGSGHIPTFANDLETTASSNSHGAATGQVVVERGARIATHVPQTVTEGGGYVLLLGGEVHNAGQITTDG
ncbi:filamentous hemagglutinin N-terminal domain-containing protein, partial [Alcaligenaceae bacterium SAGV3]|nr:filamentous hemagglutinin N-terminal domain-containing protein [Alcaligenaceae bacterium SAGV3]